MVFSNDVLYRMFELQERKGAIVIIVVRMVVLVDWKIFFGDYGSEEKRHEVNGAKRVVHQVKFKLKIDKNSKYQQSPFPLSM